MANEITLGATFKVSKNGADVNPGAFSKQVTMNNNGMVQIVQNIGTTTEALILTDIATPGYFALKNVGAATIALSQSSPAATATGMITLKTSEFALFPSRLGTIYAIAYGVASNLLVCACET